MPWTNFGGAPAEGRDSRSRRRESVHRRPWAVVSGPFGPEDLELVARVDLDRDVMRDQAHETLETPWRSSRARPRASGVVRASAVCVGNLQQLLVEVVAEADRSDDVLGSTASQVICTTEARSAMPTLAKSSVSDRTLRALHLRSPALPATRSSPWGPLRERRRPHGHRPLRVRAGHALRLPRRPHSGVRGCPRRCEEPEHERGQRTSRGSRNSARSRTWSVGSSPAATRRNHIQKVIGAMSSARSATWVQRVGGEPPNCGRCLPGEDGNELAS
jgi:hypothetical protein